MKKLLFASLLFAAASPKRGFPCGGVAITHRAPDIPPYVVFFTVNAAAVLEEFRKHGILRYP